MSGPDRPPEALPPGVLAVGLTGGIGSGKSTAAAGLARRGAVVVDADALAREVVAPGGEAYEAVLARFGRDLVGPDGQLDRARLAATVFADPAARADLEALVHPAVGARMAAARLAPRPPGSVVVFDVPLLRPAHRQLLALDLVVVVDCPPELALRRLQEGRGMAEADARSRMAAQPSREERLALADWVLDNSGRPEELEAQLDTLWAELLRRARAGSPPTA
ncbi:dephospho-CoA kinase [Aciditerrimonas ferrireducens]|uniref:dephospho-CoA kinase n=1 Tax=Aciditerrimonas ferrireducens TaxID=667306 RepID=UPI002002D3F1|nr:dephospho-CoA kinase [Aciditerrimonas ferrireducens]MCK4176775.1 dephospho-CoA kinase [Aciditerrimonas ferrireducens]